MKDKKREIMKTQVDTTFIIYTIIILYDDKVKRKRLE